MSKGLLWTGWPEVHHVGWPAVAFWAHLERQQPDLRYVGCSGRAFLETAAGLGLTVSEGVFAKTAAWATEPSANSIPKRPLGKTGHQVSIYGLGGLFTLARHDRHDQAVEIVNRALDLGVTYIDTSAFYGDGASELNIGTVR